jgi:hypothetical protein
MFLAAPVEKGASGSGSRGPSKAGGEGEEAEGPSKGCTMSADHFGLHDSLVKVRRRAPFRDESVWCLSRTYPTSTVSHQRIVNSAADSLRPSPSIFGPRCATGLLVAGATGTLMPCASSPARNLKHRARPLFRFSQILRARDYGLLTLKGCAPHPPPSHLPGLFLDRDFPLFGRKGQALD